MGRTCGDANEIKQDTHPEHAAIRFIEQAVGFHKPHLPFVASAQYFVPYPPSGIALPPDQEPPAGMPPVAWSSYGELRNYADQASRALGRDCMRGARLEFGAWSSCGELRNYTDQASKTKNC